MSEEKISQVKNALLVHNNDSYLRTLIKFTHSKTKSLSKPKAVFWDKERGSSENVLYMISPPFILFFT